MKIAIKEEQWQRKQTYAYILYNIELFSSFFSIPRGWQLKKSSYAPQKITKKSQKISKNHKKIKKSQKISKNLFKFNMGEIVKIKKSSKKNQNLQNFG